MCDRLVDTRHQKGEIAIIIIINITGQYKGQKQPLEVFCKKGVLRNFTISQFQA